jgi:FkbM family methyltransferase
MPISAIIDMRSLADLNQDDIYMLGFGNVYSIRLASTLISLGGLRITLMSNANAGRLFHDQLVLPSTHPISQSNKRAIAIICAFSSGARHELVTLAKSTLLISELYTIEEFIVAYSLPKSIIGFPSDFLLNSYKLLGSNSVFADELSVETAKAMCSYWSKGHAGCLAKICRPIDQIYFDEQLICNRKDHSYVDIGAFNGDTFFSFLRRFKEFERAFLFEPRDLPILNRLRSDKIDVRNIALGRHSGLINMSLAEDAESPNFDEYGASRKIRMSTLDEELQCVSFIKIDCEGFDIDVLFGAKTLITQHKPIIALCVYHVATHLLEGINFLQEFSEYDLYLRKYSHDPAELVLYGIPNSRR